MTALSLFGFLVLVLIAVWLTGVGIGTSLAEKGFMGSVTFGWVFLAMAVAMWVLVFLASPFHVSIGMQ